MPTAVSAVTAGTTTDASPSILVRPIRTEADYEATLAEISDLLDATPGSPEDDRLDVLTTLVEAYEAQHYPMDPPDPIEAIRFRMDQQGLAPKDLEPFIGSRARVSEVLNRRRPLSITMIRALEQGLGIPASVLIRPSSVPAIKPAASKRGGVKRTLAKRETQKSGAKGGRSGKVWPKELPKKSRGFIGSVFERGADRKAAAKNPGKSTAKSATTRTRSV